MDTTILLLVLAPLLGFVLTTFFGKQLGGTTAGYLATAAVLVSFVLSCMHFVQVKESGQAIIYPLLDWIQTDKFAISLSVTLDQLSLLWLLFVTGIGALIHLYSVAYMHDDANQSKFFSYLNLFVFFMILLVTSSNLVVMFIGWEGVGLCSYLLIGFWHQNQAYNDAAKKAFIMNRIGDLGFLVGMFLLATQFVTLDFNSLQNAIASTPVYNETVLAWAALALFIGACGKSAQLPLYTWLPDAMAGPTPVSALIHAATMVTAGIFMITRLNFLFGLEFAGMVNVSWVIAIVGGITSLWAAMIALAQNDIKKVLAYSTVSQLGLMFLALGLGAYKIAVFHVITHAFFKACLFLGSGSVIHAMGGEQDMRKMGNLRKAMPVTFGTMLISTIAIAGIPPLSGFFSKDEILMTAFQEDKLLWIVASFASVLTALYMFRMLFLTFFGEFRGSEDQRHHLHESPALMTFPLIVLAILAAVGGLISLPGNSWLNAYLAPIIKVTEPDAHHALGSTAYGLMAVAVVGALIGLFIAFNTYIKRKEVPPTDEEMKGFNRTLYNKLYVDEVYDKSIVQPINHISLFLRDGVEVALSNIVFGFARFTQGFGLQGKSLQNGNVGFYLFAFVLGLIAIISYIFLSKIA